MEEPVDAGRYLDALRRHAALILGAAVAVALLVFLISLLLPSSYTASAKIAPSVQATTSAASGSTSGQQNLATIQAYVTSPAVLAVAADGLPGETAASLRQKVSTSLDTNANIVAVTASDGNAGRAARIATDVAETFLNVRAAGERAQFAAQEASLTVRMQAAQAAGQTGLASALAQQISTVAAQAAAAGSDLQLLSAAAVPGSPTSPRPERNAAFAFIVVLFLGILAVIGRELMAPSLAGDRELSGLTGMPVLGRVPRVSNPRPTPSYLGVDRSSVDPAAEAYRFLCKSIEVAAWPNRSRLLAVTSAVREEGKTTVVSRLGMALAETGARTLLVSADLRWPALHEEFGLPLGDGLSTVLSTNGRPDDISSEPPATCVAPNLYVLTSGPVPADPAALLTNYAVRALFERIRALEFDYVLFDLPPLTAVAEAQLFVRHADAALLVAFAGRANAEQLSQTRELLNRLPVWRAGMVVLGVGREGRPRGRATAPRAAALREDGE